MIAHDVPEAQVVALPSASDGRDATLSRIRLEEILLQVLTDREVSPYARSVFAVLDHLYNMKTGYAYPNQSRIVEAVGGTREAVSKAIAQLERRGYIRSYGWSEVPAEHRGKKRQGRFYRIVETGYACPFHATKDHTCAGVRFDTHTSDPGVESDTSGRVESDTPGRVESDTPYRNPGREPRKGTPVPPSPTVATLPAGTTDIHPPKAIKRKTTIPEGFEPTEAMIAMTVAKGLDREEVLEQTEQFKLYHGSKGTLGLDWNKGWHYWMNQHKPGGRFASHRATNGRVTNKGPMTRRNTDW